MYGGDDTNVLKKFNLDADELEFAVDNENLD